SGIDALNLLREMNRVARARVIVSDLRRSWLAAAGLWIVSFPLGFHAVSRHDGVVSVMRGFTPNELVDTVHKAIVRRPRAHRRRGVVEMAAFRPFTISTRSRGRLPLNWPTWWLSEMSVDDRKPSIRFKHIKGITKGMDVEWTFSSAPNGTHVRIVHVWDGPNWPLIGEFAASWVIGPVFVHGIASRTLAGLAAIAEKRARVQQ